jgi:Uma2 family endonuclease
MDYARMRAIADELSERKESWAVEISGNHIIMMMRPAKRHELIAFRVADQINEQLRGTEPRVIAQSGAEVEDPAGAAALRRPDVMILPLAALDAEGDTVDPADVLAVVEVVSKSNPENDYLGKTRDYAVMGIEQYLLVDPRKGNGMVLSSPHPTPEGPRYAQRLEFTFGETVQLGPWRIETAEFPLY